MPIATRTFRVFVSSTFEDLKEERDLLQRDVFPKLRALCEQHGAGFQAIDLRWGIRDEAALDQKTMEICLREIRRCQATGIKPNFIVLLGDRYGWRPLPARIPVSELDPRAVAGDWYKLDENAVPPEYVLQPRAGVFTNPDIWGVMEQVLHARLEAAARAAGVTGEALDKYVQSATHQEIIAGLGGDARDREHVFAFVRNPDESKVPELSRVIGALRGALPEGNVVPFSNRDLEALSRGVTDCLERVIEAEARRFQSRSALEREKDAHGAFAREHCRYFVGRKRVLAEIAQFLGCDDKRPLVIHGKPGSGKSAIIARASEDQPGIRRFICATPESSNGFALLRSLCAELAERYGQSGDLPATFNELTVLFQDRLRLATGERPILLYIDAVDQLSPQDPATAMNWLPRELPPHCRLVCSTANVPAAARNARFVPLEGFSTWDAARALRCWFKDSKRSLQKAQRKKLLGTFRETGSPLYLKLAFEEARLWRSFDPLDRCVLGDGLPSIVSQLFERLSKPENHGAVLLRHALGFLAAARYGLTEDEVLGVLAANNDVWQDFMKVRKHDLPEYMLAEGARQKRQLPVVVWSRLYLDLEPYLTERLVPGGTTITFFHGQVHQAATEYCLGGPSKPNLHGDLAELFDRACKAEPETYLPLTRPIAELAYHHRMCDNRRCLKAIYANVSYLCSYVKSNDAFQLKDEMHSVPDECIDPEVRLLIARAASLLVEHAEQAPQLMYKELVTEGYREQARRLAIRPWIRVDPVAIADGERDGSIGISPVATWDTPVQASCVARNANMAFVLNAPNKIAIVQTADLRPLGEITLPGQRSAPVKMLLCDGGAKLVGVVYDGGDIDVLRTAFGPSREALPADCIHRGECITGKFGAISACASMDEIIYQAVDGTVVSLHLAMAGKRKAETAPSGGKTLMSCFDSNARCHAWREGMRYLLTFRDSGAHLRLDYRALAVCQTGSRLVVSTEENKLLVYRLPTLDIEKAISCPLPILSINPCADGVLLMTDRHGNILSLDSNLQMVEHGPCSRDGFDHYPSAIYPSEHGALYISNSGCVALAFVADAKRDILAVDGGDDGYNLLRYSRTGGFTLSLGRGVPRPLPQHMLRGHYEHEFENFKVAWSPRGAVAYADSDLSATVESGELSMRHRTDSEIRKILYLDVADAFLIFARSGMFHLVDIENQQHFQVSSPRSDSGHYLVEACGQYVCVAAHDVLRRPAFGNAYVETVLSLYGVHRSRDSLRAEAVDVQRIDNRQPR